MAITLADIEAQVKARLNATTQDASYGATPDNPLFKNEEIRDAVLAAARAVMQAIYDNPNHRYRAEVIELQAVMQGQVFKGPIGAVYIDGDLGTKISNAKLRKYRKATVSLTTTTAGAGYGYYAIEGKIISFIGSNCQVETMKDNLSGSDFNVPDEYYGAVLAGALHFSFSKQGQNVEAAGVYGQTFAKMLDMISSSAVSVPAPTAHGAMP